MDRPILTEVQVTEITERVQQLQILDLFGDALDAVTHYMNKESNLTEFSFAACRLLDALHELCDAYEELERVRMT